MHSNHFRRDRVLSKPSKIQADIFTNDFAVFKHIATIGMKRECFALKLKAEILCASRYSKFDVTVGFGGDVFLHAVRSAIISKAPKLGMYLAYYTVQPKLLLMN